VAAPLLAEKSEKVESFTLTVESGRCNAESGLEAQLHVFYRFTPK